MTLEFSILGRQFAFTAKALPPLRPVTGSGSGGWWPIVREPYAGAWQQNQELRITDVLSYGPVFSCVTMIAADIGKLPLRLVRENDSTGIWTPTANPAFSPVLRKPNRYSTRIKFVERWITSKLIWGNTYVLKERDARGIVIGLYVLNPQYVTPLIAPDGAVYYELGVDHLNGVPVLEPPAVPASEIIHDTMVCLYHPLCGVSPIYACGLAAMQGLAIQNNSNQFFTNGSNPGGVLTAPGSINDDTAKRLKDYWDTNFTGPNAGKVAVLGDGLKYEASAVNAQDAELIKQLEWTGSDICACYHVPGWLVGIGPPPPYANFGPIVQAYYSECLQSLINNLELSLDEGLGLLTPINGTQYGTECDINDLIWMDQEMRAKVAGETIQHGALSPNEARQQYFGLGPVAGGDTPYLQEQNWPLALLAARQLPMRPPTPPAPVPPPAPTPPPVKHVDMAAMRAAAAAALARKLAA